MATIEQSPRVWNGITILPESVTEQLELGGPRGPYTRADQLRLTEEIRCELIEGHLIMSPAPLRPHQVLAGFIFRTLDEIADQYDSEALISPMDVIFSDYDTFQPDIVYVSKSREHILQDWVEGVPSLVVEVLSPSSIRRDQKLKFSKFLEYSVPEYWLFDPVKQTVEIYLLNQNEYRKFELPDDSVPYRSPMTPEIEFKFGEMWRKFRHKIRRRT